MSDKEQANNAGQNRTGALKIIVLLAIVAGVVVSFRLLPLNEYLRTALDWIKAQGTAGYLVYSLIYILICVVPVSGGVLTVAGGFIYGVARGTVIVVIASNAGALAAFFIARTFARGWVQKKIEGNVKLAAVEKAAGRQGFKIVLLTRLSPVFPFVLLNYFYGLTSVPWWKYALANIIGMLPGTIMFVYIGSVAQSLAAIIAGDVQEGSTGKNVLLIVGFLVTVVVTILITRIARKALKQAVPSEGEEVSQGKEEKR